MSARDQVESLLAIIKEAAFDALDEYEKTGQATPTLDSLNRHPLDDAEDKLRLKKIISKLEGACEQLCTTLAPPTHTIMNRAQDFGWACLRVAVQQKFADELTKHPDGLHVDALSDKVKVHPMKLASILRVLAAKHCFREVAPDVFTNNRLSVNLVSGHPMSALVDLITVDGQKSALALSDYVIDPQFGQSLSMSEAAFQYSNRNQGVEGITFYEWLQLSQGRRKIMMKAMISMNDVLGSLSALHVYPWSQPCTVCDVGSGMGGFSRSLLEMFPDVHVTQFDLPKTIALAKQHWKDDFGERVTFVEGDFFKEVPVKNCDIYYLRNILHNWTDEKALAILQSVRASMRSHSRVLVHDHVLRHMSPMSGSDADGLDKAPEPLLPNYGAGQIRLYHQDMTMMMMYNTRERTTIEMTKIAQEAKLRLLTIFDLAEMCLLEFGIADD
ncbi:O-methyltransferase-domain-containing protein [Flammula alnicola]|nr:O-methyltransferase-domain-containing protein [Flammula alnicola]